MSRTRQLERKNDLTSRVFNNCYFGIAWVLFLAFVVRLVWPLRDAWLVIWVFGSKGYFQQGIRVIKEKPTMFSNGLRPPDLPDMVTGFSVFLVVTGGLSLLLMWALRLYEKLINPRVQNNKTAIATLTIVRDAFFILVLLEFGPPLMAILFQRPVHEPGYYTNADAISTFLLGIAGFTLSACLAPNRRWRHLAYVAVAVWFFCFLKGIFIEGDVLAGISTAMIMAALMTIGGMLSYLFVPLKPDSSL